MKRKPFLGNVKPPLGENQYLWEYPTLDDGATVGQQANASHCSTLTALQTHYLWLLVAAGGPNVLSLRIYRVTILVRCVLFLTHVTLRYEFPISVVMSISPPVIMHKPVGLLNFVNLLWSLFKLFLASILRTLVCSSDNFDSFIYITCVAVRNFKCLHAFYLHFKMWLRGLQTFRGRLPHPLLWAGLRAARKKKIKINGISSSLNYCVIYQYIHNSQMWTQAA